VADERHRALDLAPRERLRAGAEEPARAPGVIAAMTLCCTFSRCRYASACRDCSGRANAVRATSER